MQQITSDSLEKLMLNARSKGRKDLNALIRHVVSHREALFSALPVLYHHLDPARLAPELSTRQLRQNLDLTIIGLAAFLPVDLRTDNPNAPKLHASLLEHWALLWCWVQFMTSRCILRADEFGDDMRHQAIFTVTNFYQFSMGDPFRHKVLTRPGIRVVFQVWASVVHDAALDDAHELLGDTRMALYAVLSACQAAVGNPPRAPYAVHVRAVLDEPAMNYELIAVGRLARAAAHAAADGTTPALRDAIEQLSVLVALGEFSARALHRLLAARLLPSLAALLAYFAQRPVDAGGGALTLDLLLKCSAGLLAGANASPHSALWMAQAVEGHMIHTLLTLHPRAFAYASTHGVGHVSDSISWSFAQITRHLLHRPVFCATLRELRRTDPAGLLGPDRSTRSLYDVWEKLTEVMKQRILAEPPGRKYRRRCGYPDCPGQRGFLRRCGGCFQLFYCSARCQRRDWAHNDHRAKCQDLQRHHREGVHASVPHAQGEYFVDVAMRMSAGQLQSFYTQLRAVPAGRVAVLTLDHTCVPTRISVWSLDPEDPHAAEHRREITDAFLEWALTARAERQALVEVVYSNTGSVQQMLAIR